MSDKTQNKITLSQYKTKNTKTKIIIVHIHD